MEIYYLLYFNLSPYRIILKGFSTFLPHGRKLINNFSTVNNKTRPQNPNTNPYKDLYYYLRKKKISGTTSLYIPIKFP